MAWVNAIIQGVLTGGLYALFACGLSLMFGVMKVVNLAHGDLAVVAGYVAIGVITVTHIPVLWSFADRGPGDGGGRLRAAAHAHPGLAGPGRADHADRDLRPVRGHRERAAAVLHGQQPRHRQRALAGAGLVHASGRRSSIGYLLVVIFATAVVVLLGLQYFLSASRYGRLIRAVADDQEAAQLSGVNYRHVFGIAAGIAFGTVALAGIFYGMYSQLAPTTGTDTILLFAFAAVVIGGLGSLWGTLLGGVVLGVAQQIGAQISISDEVLAGYIVFLLVLVLRPQGLTARRSQS